MTEKEEERKLNSFRASRAPYQRHRKRKVPPKQRYSVYVDTVTHGVHIGCVFLLQLMEPESVVYLNRGSQSLREALSLSLQCGDVASCPLTHTVVLNIHLTWYRRWLQWERWRLSIVGGSMMPRALLST